MVADALDLDAVHALDDVLLTSDMPAGFSSGPEAPVAVARCASPMPMARVPTKSFCARAVEATSDDRHDRGEGDETNASDGPIVYNADGVSNILAFACT